MADELPRRYALAGHEKGKTVNKGGFQFTKGVYVHEGAHSPTEELMSYLARSYYAFPEGSQQFKDADERFQREQKTGKTEASYNSPVSTGAENEQPSKCVKEAVDSLDHEKDEHWDENGKPKVSVVADLAGERVTRQAIELVAPGYNRASAKAAAAI